MKAAFNITPVSAEKNSLHLLVETGSYGISFLWFSKNPFSVRGLAVHNVTGRISGTGITEILKATEDDLAGLSSVTICFDFKESLLVPAIYNQPQSSKEALALLYGDNQESYYNNDLITAAGVHNHYRVPAEIEAVFARHFPAAAIFHSSSLQAEMLNRENELLYCLLFHNVLKIILYKDGKLQIAGHFDYTVPEDVAYHLLNVCERHAIKPAEVRLRLSGMIEEESRLYMELYKYFLNISFEEVPADVYITAALKELPNHYFSHLTALASCVS